MADETDTPAPDAKPAPRRRASPRKAAGDAPKRTGTRRKAADKGVVATVEEAAGHAASSAKDAATQAATSAKDAVTSAAAAVKPRASSRRTTRGTDAKKTTKRGSAKKDDGKGVRWGAIAGGVAAVGAATAALLTLRGSSAKPAGAAKAPATGGSSGQGNAAPVGSGTAHQPDGTDSTASFQAGIADENTVPDKV